MYKRILSTILTISILFNMVGCERKKFFDTKKDPHELEELIGYEDISKWILEINKIAPEFEYKDYYFNEKDLKEIYRKSLTTKECENKGKNSYKELYKEIIKNNSKFGESPFSHINSKDSNESEIYANYSLALYKALQNIFEGKEDMYEDYCKLKDVVILIGAIEGNTVANYNRDDNLITVDHIKIKKYYEGRKISLIEYLTETIEHEINHARQNSCDCRLDKGQKYIGVNHILKDNEENYYYFLKGLMEATAESAIYTDEITEASYYNSEEFGYKEERKNLSLLMLLGMFKKDFTKDKLYDVIYDSDLTKLYELYEIEDIKDLTMFYNILYALETKAGRTPLSNYLEKTNKKLDRTYKIYIYREAVKNLMKKIYNKEFELSESIVLYNYIKLYTIYNEAEFDEENYYQYDETFINDIKQIEMIFCDFLSNHYTYDKNNFTLNQKLGILDTIINYREVMFLRAKEWGAAMFITDIVEKYPIIIEIDYAYNIGYQNSIERFENQYEEILSRKLNK